MINDLPARVKAFNKTVVKFQGRPYAIGSVDCLKVARFHAVQMGHKPPRSPRYTTELGAVRQLRKLGFASVEELLSSLYPKIAPSRALIGDLLVGEGEGGLDAVFISGGRQILGFHEDSDKLEFILPEKLRCAYRL